MAVEVRLKLKAMDPGRLLFWNDAAQMIILMHVILSTNLSRMKQVICLWEPRTKIMSLLPTVIFYFNLEANHTLSILGYHFSSQLTITLNLCLIYFKITWTLAILLERLHKKYNRTKIKGGCQSRRKVVTHNSNRDFPPAL